MLRLIGLAISIGLADSMNPSTIAPALYLASGERPRSRLVQFTLGVFVVDFVGGAILVFGPGELLLSLVPHPSHTTRYVLELLAGVAMLIAAASGLAGSLLSVPERPGLRESIFNVSALILSAAPAGLTFLALGGYSGRPVTHAGLRPVCVTAAVYYPTNATLAALAVDRRGVGALKTAAGHWPVVPATVIPRTIPSRASLLPDRARVREHRVIALQARLEHRSRESSVTLNSRSLHKGRRKLAQGQLTRIAPVSRSNCMIRFGSDKATTLKIAVVAPIPSPSESTATAVKPGFDISIRMP